MYAGDEPTSRNDSGPVSASADCWLDCVADLDADEH